MAAVFRKESHGSDEDAVVLDSDADSTDRS